MPRKVYISGQEIARDRIHGTHSPVILIDHSDRSEEHCFRINGPGFSIIYDPKLRLGPNQASCYVEIQDGVDIEVVKERPQ